MSHGWSHRPGAPCRMAGDILTLQSQQPGSTLQNGRWHLGSTEPIASSLATDPPSPNHETGTKEVKWVHSREVEKVAIEWLSSQEGSMCPVINPLCKRPKDSTVHGVWWLAHCSIYIRLKPKYIVFKTILSPFIHEFKDINKCKSRLRAHEKNTIVASSLETEDLGSNPGATRSRVTLDEWLSFSVSELPIHKSL